MSPWPALLAAPPAGLRLRYRTGLARHAAGETALELDGQGLARVANRRGPEVLRYAVRLPAPEAAAVWRALAAAGFPDAPAQTAPPGPGLAVIEVEGGPAHEPVLLHRSFARDLPAWLEVLRRLDAACVAASGGVIVPA